MTDASKPRRFLFPRWANYLAPGATVIILGAAGYIPVLLGLGFSPKTTDVGYAPPQPVKFEHSLHAGELGIDCRYCHTTVEKAPFAAVPPTQTCLNCHSNLKPDSPALLAVRESALSGLPIEWTKVHSLPDYSYFNHSAHVNKGIGCVSCHGRVDQMDVVAQTQPLSMGWCLDCHRNPEPHLRPLTEITNMSWQPPDEGRETFQSQLRETLGIRDVPYMTSCSVCHR